MPTMTSLSLPSPSRRRAVGALVLLAALVAACATQPDAGRYGDEPGFFLGLFHGWTMLFAFVGGLFSDTIEIYAFPNTGWPYDLGYVFGAAIFFSGAGAAAKD